MDIGAVLADDKTSYLVFCQQEMWHFFVKRIVQCSTDEITRLLLRIENRRHGPFCYGSGILRAIKSLLGSHTCTIYLSIADFKNFLLI